MVNDNKSTLKSEVILKFVPHLDTNNDGEINDIKVFKFICDLPNHATSHPEYDLNYIAGYMQAMQDANSKLWNDHNVDIITSDNNDYKAYNKIFFLDQEVGWSGMYLYRKAHSHHLDSNIKEVSMILNEKDLAETQPKNNPPLVGRARPGTEFISDPDNE